ncbi:MAG: sensor histidine kinase [Lachnospiraceae bacterium]
MTETAALQIAALLAAVLAGVCVWLAILLRRDRRRERKLAELTQYLMRLQDQSELPQLSRCREGQTGILQSELYKLMIQMKEQSSGAVREKEYLADMLSDISHQIKTPLAAVTIMTDLLKTPGLPEEKRMEFTQRIDDSVTRITWLIRNLLTLSQLDANRLKLKREQVMARALLDTVLQPFELLLELKELQLCVECAQTIELTCDRHWSGEALSNIVKNCIEHTPPGGQIMISVSQNNFSTNICIRDNGEGIDREQLSHIFERFYKGSNQSAESVGIGLAIAEKIITLQNGTVTVQSEVGKGTEFLVKLYR